MNDSKNMNNKANKSLDSANKFMVPPVLDPSRLESLRPTRAVTKEEIEAFWRDGVVKLEGILPTEAADFLGDCFEDIFSRDPSVGGKARLVGTEEKMVQAVEKEGLSDRLLVDGGYKGPRTGRFRTEANCFRWHTDLHRWCMDSPLPEVVAQLLETKRLKFYADHLFYKEAGSNVRTGMHQDSAFFSLRGEQVAICWVPCEVVTKENGCMCYVKGSHRWTTGDERGVAGANRERGQPYFLFQPNNLLTTKANPEVNQPMSKYMPSEMPPMPDIEGNEQDYEVVYHEVKPGDVVVHHVNTIHGAAGNTSSTQHRRGASIRYIGDDAVFEQNRAGAMLGGMAYNPLAKLPKGMTAEKLNKGNNLKGVNPGGMTDGTPLEGALYPLVYPYEEQHPSSKL